MNIVEGLFCKVAWMGGICIKCRSRGQRGPTFHTSPLGGETFYSFSTVFLFKVDQALKTKNTAKLCSFSTVFLVFKVVQALKIYENTKHIQKKYRAEIPFCTLHHFSMKLPNLLLISFFSTSLWNNKKLQLPVFYKKCCHLENWTANKSRKILIFAVWLSTVSDV